MKAGDFQVFNLQARVMVERVAADQAFFVLSCSGPSTTFNCLRVRVAWSEGTARFGDASSIGIPYSQKSKLAD